MALERIVMEQHFLRNKNLPYYAHKHMPHEMPAGRRFYVLWQLGFKSNAISEAVYVLTDSYPI
jgi:hypothetical protein